LADLGYIYIFFLKTYSSSKLLQTARVVFRSTTLNITNLSSIKKLLITNLHYRWFCQECIMNWPIISADLSSFMFMILGFFSNQVCFSLMQVTLQTLIDKIRYFVKFTVKC